MRNGEGVIAPRDLKLFTERRAADGLKINSETLLFNIQFAFDLRVHDDPRGRTSGHRSN